jgi:hypothetical protein
MNTVFNAEQNAALNTEQTTVQAKKMSEKSSELNTCEQSQNSSYYYHTLKNVSDVVKYLKNTHKKKKYNSIRKYDLDRIIEVLEKAETENIKKEEELISQKAVLNKNKSIGKAYKDRMEIYTTLWNNLKSQFITMINPDIIKPNGGITGSFIRQLFELPHAMANDFSEKGFGNPIGHDLDIVLFLNLIEYDKPIIADAFHKIMKKYQEHITFSCLNPDIFKPIEIANKKLIQICNVTLSDTDLNPCDPIGKRVLIGIPHYVLKFKDISDSTIFEVDLLAYKPNTTDGWTNTDFNVNGLVMGEFGVACDHHNSTFNDFLTSIARREAICHINFDEINYHATIPGVLREERVPYFMQIAWMLRNRFKILNYGYKNIVSSNTSLIDYSIQTEDDCCITSCAPPYYDIKLKCSHKISLMAYIGIIEESKFDSSEAIRCPLCREDLVVNLIMKEPEKPKLIEIKTYADIINKELKECKLEEKEEKKILSEDSDQYIKDMINKHTPTADPSVETIMPSIGRGSTHWDTS